MSKRKISRSVGYNSNIPPIPHTTGKQAKIQSWLMSEGWTVGEAQSEQALWAIGATDGAGRPVVIAQLKHPSDHLMIQVQLNFDADISQKLEKLGELKRNRLFWDIRLAMLDAGVEFKGIEHPLKEVVMFRRLYDDALSKDAFSQRVFQVKCAALKLHWMLMRELQESPLDFALARVRDQVN